MIIALFSASFFMALEAVVLLYAINNRHFAYYYGFIGLGGLLFVLLSHYLYRKKPPTILAIKMMYLFTCGIIYLLLFCGVLLLGLNYYLNESMSQTPEY